MPSEQEPGTANALDHLVIAAANLSQGCDYIEELLGVRPQPGGQHTSIGTHNAVLGLGPDCYLEVIAVDPELPAPERSRWFSLDDDEVRNKLQQRPQLIHWVCRTADINVSSSVATQLFGPICPMSRGPLDWLITIADDGSLPLAGVAPSLIQWPRGQGPSSRLPEHGLRLQQLKLETPDSEELKRVLSGLKLVQNHITVIDRAGVRLQAIINTAAGERLIK